MMLFDDTEIFSQVSGGRRIFDMPDADLLLIDNFFNKEESDHYYNFLYRTVQWREYEMPMYDKVVTAPRMISWYGDSNRGERKSNPGWPSELLTIRQRVEQETLMRFNAVLLNLYRNGSDGVGWHSDKTSSSNKNMNIASVTFGETRMFRLRHKTLKHIAPIEIPLHHGPSCLWQETPTRTGSIRCLKQQDRYCRESTLLSGRSGRFNAAGHRNNLSCC